MRTVDGAELGNRPPIHRDGEALTALRPTEHVTHVVAQLSLGNADHEATVAIVSGPVRARPPALASAAAHVSGRLAGQGAEFGRELLVSDFPDTEAPRRHVAERGTGRGPLLRRQALDEDVWRSDDVQGEGGD